MAIPWITALKMVPWGDVIEAAPSVIKTAKGLLKKAPAQNDTAPAPSPASSAVTSTPADAGELALQHIIQLQKRIDQLEHAQQASAAVIEQMAEQQARIVETVGLLRTGATRLAWACAILAGSTLGLGIYSFLR